MDTGLPGLELRHLVALVAVADTGTFSRAAEQLGYTQSAVSQQIAALERVAGTALFDRPGGPRPVQPTQAGAVLTEHARAVLARLRGAAADVASVAAGESGRLRVGTVQSVGTQVLPSLAASLRHRTAGDRDRAAGVATTRPSCWLSWLRASSTSPSAKSPPRTVRSTIAPSWSTPSSCSPLPLAPEAERRSVRLEEIAALPLIGYRNPAASG